MTQYLFSEQFFSDTSLSQVAQVTKSIKKTLLCKTNPIYAFFRPKIAIMRKNKPKQTQFKPKTKPIPASQPLSKPKQTQFKPKTNPISSWPLAGRQE